MIKFWSYKHEYRKLNKIFLRKIDKTIKSGNIFFGNELKKFEKKFIKSNKSKYGIAVGSGTDALLISLTALNIKPGDEVITAANTAIPTISAILNSGAKPKLVDIGDDYLIDVDKIEKAITSKTRAIIPVHLYGQMCNMSRIEFISKKYKIPIIEDCAQSQGARYKKKFSGTIGKFGCFSFYPTKILGAYGDGGFILAKNFSDYKKIKRLRFYGIETMENNKFKNKYYANENGFNSRLDEIQASILNIKLNNLGTFIAKRKKLASLYIKNLSSTDLKLPIKNKDCEHVYHLFTVYHPKANLIQKKMLNLKIETRKIYPFPIHKMKAYSKLITNNKELKNSEIKSKGIFCLPLYPEMKPKTVKIICQVLKKIIKKN
jgi:aminotransferase EvaB